MSTRAAPDRSPLSKPSSLPGWSRTTNGRSSHCTWSRTGGEKRHARSRRRRSCHSVALARTTSPRWVSWPGAMRPQSDSASRYFRRTRRHRIPGPVRRRPEPPPNSAPCSTSYAPASPPSTSHDRSVTTAGGSPTHSPARCSTSGAQRPSQPCQTAGHRVLWRPVAGPPLRGDRERLLGGLLGQIDVPRKPTGDARTRPHSRWKTCSISAPSRLGRRRAGAPRPRRRAAMPESAARAPVPRPDWTRRTRSSRRAPPCCRRRGRR